MFHADDIEHIINILYALYSYRNVKLSYTLYVNIIIVSL